VTPGDRACEKATEQLRSENALLKGRATLLQRENSVIKDENLQRKKDMGEQRARIERLEADVASLREQYARDLALRDTRYKSLEQQNEVLKKESSDKIRDLTRLNSEIQKGLEDELKRVNEEAAKNRDAWNTERETLKKDGAQKEFTLQKQMDAIKKETAAKEEEIASQKTLISEQQAKLDRAGKEIESGKDALARLEKLVAELKERLSAPGSSEGGIKKP